MLNLKNCLLILTVFCGGCISSQWPKQIKRCSLSAPNLNKCVLEAAKSAIPHLGKGIKEWNLPPIDPYVFQNLTLKNNAPPLEITFHVRNGTLRDTTTSFSIQKMWYDKKKNELHFESTHKRLRMAGNYNLKGQLFVFDVNDIGHFDLELRGISHYHIAKLPPSKTRKGFSDIIVGYKLKEIRHLSVGIKDTSLSPSVEHGLVRILNENQDIVSRLMIPTAEQGFQTITNHLIRPLFRRFKFSEIFLP